MRKNTAVTTVALATLTLGVALAGCGTKTETQGASSKSTSASSSISPSAAAPASSGQPAGPHTTIDQYITENKIAETPVKPGDPGSPKFDFPFPPGWSDAGPKTPDWAYGAIVYDQPQDPNDPPTMIAIVSKLTGNADPAKIIEYAPGELQNFPAFQPVGDPQKTTMAGFDAVEIAGTYENDGKKRAVAQRTVVIPSKQELYVLQLDATALVGEENVVIDAADAIDKQAKIVP